MRNIIFTVFIFGIFIGCAPFMADYYTVDSWSDCDAMAKKENWKYLYTTNRHGHIPHIEPSGADVVCYAQNETNCVILNRQKCYTQKITDELYKTSCSDHDVMCESKVRLYKKTK